MQDREATDLSFRCEQKQIPPFHENVLHRRDQRFAMRDKFEIGIQQCEGRSTQDVTTGVNAILSECLTLARLRLWRTNQCNIVSEGIDGGLGVLKSITGTSPTGAVCVNCILSCNENFPSFAVQSHASQTTSRIFQNPRRLTLSSPCDDKSQDPTRRRDVKYRDSATLCLQARYGLLRLENNPLPRPAIVNQITPDDRHGAVGKSHRDLRKVLDNCKGRYLYSRSALPCNSSP